MLRKIYRRHQSGEHHLHSNNLILIERALGINTHADKTLAALGEVGALVGGLGGSVGLALYEQLGLIPHFNIFAGSSAGAISIPFAITGQATEGTLGYIRGDDALDGKIGINSSRFFNPLRLLQHGPVADTRYLVWTMISKTGYNPLDMTKVLNSRWNQEGNLRIVATHAHTGATIISHSFENKKEFCRKLYASSFIPGISRNISSGFTRIFRDIPLADGGISCPTAISAVKEDATHAILFSGIPHDNDRSIGIKEYMLLTTTLLISNLIISHCPNTKGIQISPLARSLLSEFGNIMSEDRLKFENGAYEHIQTSVCAPSPELEKVSFLEMDRTKLMQHALRIYQELALMQFGLSLGRDIPIPKLWYDFAKLHDIELGITPEFSPSFSPAPH